MTEETNDGAVSVTYTGYPASSEEVATKTFVIGGGLSGKVGALVEVSPADEDEPTGVEITFSNLPSPLDTGITEKQMAIEFLDFIRSCVVEMAEPDHVPASEVSGE